MATAKDTAGQVTTAFMLRLTKQQHSLNDGQAISVVDDCAPAHARAHSQFAYAVAGDFNAPRPKKSVEDL
ncbi:hypothetical protein [Aquabacterium sp.]|uniref:hypothetical protein n=1 Tax=Aquabacterium sp. TaxID=1872578 RepID=UPI0019ACAC55|nr:hypothetical protein [Aquabacterium sp.]MBC7699302.1 hypothetical protein [Aquabacterium sp.]